MRKLLFSLFLILFLSNINAQSVNIMLKNSKIIEGVVVKEEPLFLLIQNDIGEIKILRQNIESISYKSSENDNSNENFNQDKIGNKNSISESNKTVLDDVVVVYLKNNEIISGKLIAKSLDMILVTTEAGSLTIPKRDIKIIEYVSTEYAERGEVVIAHLTNGTQFEGNIFYEDYQRLIINTKNGKLTIDKKNLRSIEYSEEEEGKAQETLVQQYTAVTNEQPIVSKRLDVVSVGYSPTYGTDYSNGLIIGYNDKFLLKQMTGFYISAIGGINLTYFPINKDNFTNELTPVTASGGAFITSITGGASLTLFQGSQSNYEFYIAPQVEANIVYKTLTKEYPSYPAFNEKITTTKFVFGIGNKFGLDIMLNNSKVGISYDFHFLFGDDDYNTISLNYTTKLF